MNASQVLGRLLPLLVAILALISPTLTIATTCNEDCHARCRSCISYDLGFAKDEKCVIEPRCHLDCEAEKKTACAFSTPVPSIPSPPTNPFDLPRQLNQACKVPFENFTHATIAYCANWQGRADDLFLVEDAKAYLVQLGLAQMSEFSGVDIRWCPLRGGGMAPEADRILLNPSLKNDRRQLVATLGHELQHMRQYRRWRSDDFKCRYSKELAAGKGQERANYVEREAYEFEDRVKEAWDQATSVPSPRPPPVRPLPSRLSQRCGTPFGACLMNGEFPVGNSCWCPSVRGPIGGAVF